MFIDEVQLTTKVIDKENGGIEVTIYDMLNELKAYKNLDVYVTGSNSKGLSKDIATEFRGRATQIHVFPLSFAEFYSYVGGDERKALDTYMLYGGMPRLLTLEDEKDKKDYLTSLYSELYVKDIVERNKIKVPEGLRELVRILASGIGSSTNPTRICNTFQSVSQLQITDKTINEYISDIQDAFLIEEALRYDVKGRKYIGTETKYYFCDLGLRNIVLNLRQQEETHIMENVIYNELRMRGYLVDVGLVECWTTDENGKRKRSKLEVDFVVNNGPERVYIQSAFNMPTKDKEKQERRSLINIADNFRKVIVVKDDIKRKIDDDGVVTIGLFDFLLDEQSIERY